MKELNKYFEYKDGKLYWKVSTSNRVKVGQEVGNKANNGYIEFQCNGKRFYTHRVVWEMFNGKIPEGLQIDHINGIKDDNRIENLQLVTNKQNTQRRNDTKGYYFIKKINIPRPYHSRKKFNDKQYNIGLFGTPCGAYMANRMFFVNR
tara:strand:- start:75 stop:518 length:444 start_codon:yes stop_codon:yes gene_type:complete